MGWLEDQFDWRPLAFCSHCCWFPSLHMLKKTKTKTQQNPGKQSYFKILLSRDLPSEVKTSLLPRWVLLICGPRTSLTARASKPTLVDLESGFRSQQVAMCSTLMTLFVSNNRADEVILQLMFPGIWLDKCISPGGGRGLYGRITLVFPSYRCAGPRTTSAGLIPCVCLILFLGLPN